MYTNHIHIEAAPETVSPLLEALGKDIRTGEWAREFHLNAGGTVLDAELPAETAYSVHAHGPVLHVQITYQSAVQLCWLTNALIDAVEADGLIEVFSRSADAEDGWWYAVENGTELVNRSAIGFAEAEGSDLTFIRWQGGVYTVNDERYSFEDAYSLAHSSGESTNKKLWSLFN